MARTLAQVLSRPRRKRKLLVRHTLTTTTVPRRSNHHSNSIRNRNDDNVEEELLDDDGGGGRRKKKRSELQRLMEPLNKQSKKKSKKGGIDDTVVIDDCYSTDDDDENKASSGGNHHLMSAARAMPWRFSTEKKKKKNDGDKEMANGGTDGDQKSTNTTGTDTLGPEAEWTPDGQCHGKNQKGERCGRTPKIGYLYCSKHYSQMVTAGSIAEEGEAGAEVATSSCSSVTPSTTAAATATASNSRKQPHEKVQKRCFAISKRGIRCVKPSKDGGKYCLYHISTRVNGEVDDATKTNGRGGDDANMTNKNDDEENTSSKDAAAAAQNDNSHIRQLCRAICRDGYRCSRLSLPGNPFCKHHSTEKRFGEVVSSDEEDYTNRKREEQQQQVVASSSSVEDTWRTETARQFSSGAPQCRAKNIRNERCGKPAYLENVYCYAHLNAAKRSGTIDDDMDRVAVTAATNSSNNKRRSSAGGVVGSTSSGKASTTTTDKDPTTRRPCQAACTRDGRRCAKLAYGDSIYCYAHTNIYGPKQSGGGDVVSSGGGGGGEREKFCRAISNRTGLRCARPPNPDSIYCSTHIYSGRRKKTIDDTESEEEEEEEEEESEVESEEDEDYDGEKRPRTPRERDYIYRGQPGTTQCNALTNRLRVCVHRAVEGTKFCNLHTVITPKYTKDSGMASSEGLSSKLRFFRAEPGSSQCDAFNNSGQLCPYVADDDSVHCRFHKGSDRVRHTLYTKQPGTFQCDSYSNFEDGKPCPYVADDDSTHCPLHKGSGNTRKGRASASSSKRPPKDELDFDQDDTESSEGESVEVDIPRTKSGKDAFFKGTKGQKRCERITNRGFECKYCAVNGTAYCFRHEKFVTYGVQPDKNKASLKVDDEDDVIEDDDDKKSYVDDDAGKDGDDSSLSSNDDDDDNGAAERPFSYKEFLNMWHECEEFCGEETDEIESTRRVRGANNRMSPEDTDGQAKAQYGRLLPRAMKTLMKDILCLKKDDVFLDIGHGIGNTCVQAAFTVGCEARGIEVVYGRNSIAEVFKDQLIARSKDYDGRMPVGDIQLRHGRLEDATHREFLTKGVTRAYVNNFNGVFAERSSKTNQKYFLDDYVAGLFANLEPGAVMVTLHPLSMGPTMNEANEVRVKQGMEQSKFASFYDTDRVLLGKACDTVKWNQHSGNKKNIYIYKYERLEQPSDKAVFLCCNPNCEAAKNAIPIPATMINEHGRLVINYCSCKVSTKSLRRQRRKLYLDAG